MATPKTVRSWTCVEESRAIHRITLPPDRNEHWFLIRSDVHHDSPHNDRDTETRLLNEARERGAIVIDIGDTFDAMQSRNDPRRAESGKRPEHRLQPYLSAILEDALDYYSPWADLFAVIGDGNHETKVAQHCDFHLTESLARGLTRQTGHMVHHGGYGGWIVLNARNCGAHFTVRLRYHHGSGKGAMMTFGTLDARRMASWVTNADAILCGHTHDWGVVQIARETLRADNGKYEVAVASIPFIRTGGLKNEHEDGHSGFAVERNFGPKPIGCTWLRLKWFNTTRNNARIRGYDIEATRAS